MASYQISLAPEMTAIAQLTEWLGQCCAAEGVPADTVFRLTLALEEAVANVIHYAFTGVRPPFVIRVRLEIGTESLAAEIIDNGRPFDPAAAPAPDLAVPIEQRKPGGLGIHLIRNCQKALTEAEQKVKILTQQQDGLNLEDYNLPSET